MHSSRMRTTHLLTISLLGGAPARGVPALGGVPSGGILAQGAWGVPVQVLPPANRMIDRCKNITLPKTSFVASNKVKVTHQGEGHIKVKVKISFSNKNMFYSLLCFTNVSFFGFSCTVIIT